MRRHQSWWRASVLGVPPGTGPGPGSQRPLGSMLRAADGEAGLNFLTPEIRAVAEERMASGPGVEPFRCRCNLLSSQPMAFNLFAALVGDLRLASKLMAVFLPEVVEVEEVLMEWAPTPARDYLGDRSSFDVFVGARDANGRGVAIGIECKLTEPFSAQAHDPVKYLPLTKRHPETWERSQVGQLGDIRWEQLWRNHLLAQALVDHPSSRFGTYRSVVVGHPQDPTLQDTFEGYRSRLTSAGRELVRLLTLDEIVAGLRQELDAYPVRIASLDRFDERYLQLQLSE
jgi:hypothetical protein